jgi:predicted ArsR family transcriptional regulator
MQKTRQKILEYLKRHQQATVDELSRMLDDLTAVTVRHHLDVLRREELVAPPEIIHRDGPGRPKYAYRLTEKAEGLFPRNIDVLTNHMLDELKRSLGPQQINVIFEGVAEQMAAGAPPIRQDEPFEARLDRLTDYLTQQGYEAHWEIHPEGFVLHTSNCPYSGVSESHTEVCSLDMHYISQLLGTVPRRLDHLLEGAHSCSYLILVPHSEVA